MSIQPLAPLDAQQRYTIAEAQTYLRCSRAHVYNLISSGELRPLKEGRRIYVPGGEIIRRSTLQSAV